MWGLARARSRRRGEASGGPVLGARAGSHASGGLVLGARGGSHTAGRAVLGAFGGFEAGKGLALFAHENRQLGLRGALGRSELLLGRTGLSARAGRPRLCAARFHPPEKTEEETQIYGLDSHSHPAR